MWILLIIPIMVVAFLKKLLFSRPKKSLSGLHVVITGGSSGIGKSVAIETAKLGAHVTIIARNAERLEAARKEILENCPNNAQEIKSLSLDVSNLSQVRSSLLSIDSDRPIYMLINCAGMAICGEVESYTEAQIKTLYEVNYLGTLYPIQTLVPRFKERREGIIVVTASQAALMGLYGMSVYCSFKFALRGLAEAINMELSPFNVSVTVSLPPDTDTPGYENENKDKPRETKLISGSAGLYKPEVVARKLLSDALGGEFFSYVGFESGLLTNLCVGMAPFTSLFDLLFQSIVLGPIRLISGYYISSFFNVVEKCHQEKLKVK